MSDARNEFIAKTKENLDKIDASIVNLEAKANEKKGEVRRELHATLSSIRNSKEQMERRLEELRLASEPAWEDVKRGTEQAWSALSDAVRKAGERFQ